MHREQLLIVVLPVGMTPACDPLVAIGGARALIGRRLGIVVDRAVGARVLDVAEPEQAEAVDQLAEQHLAPVGRCDLDVAGDPDPARGPALAERPLQLGLARQPEAVGHQPGDLAHRHGPHRRLGRLVVGRPAFVGLDQLGRARAIVAFAARVIDRVAIRLRGAAAVGGRAARRRRQSGDRQQVRPDADPACRPRRIGAAAPHRARRQLLACARRGEQVVGGEAHPQPAAGHDHERQAEVAAQQLAEAMASDRRPARPPSGAEAGRQLDQHRHPRPVARRLPRRQVLQRLACFHDAIRTPSWPPRIAPARKFAAARASIGRRAGARHGMRRVTTPSVMSF